MHFRFKRTVNMSEEQKTVAPEVKGNKLIKVVKLADNSEITVTKLKVGAYYKAQKIYSEVLTVLQKAVSSMQVDYSEYVDEKGNPDLKAIENKVSNKQGEGANMMDMFDALQEVNPLKLKMVSIVLRQDIKEIEENYYAEDIDKIYQAVTELNNFLENLKNSVALTASLEGKEEKQG